MTIAGISPSASNFGLKRDGPASTSAVQCRAGQRRVRWQPERPCAHLRMTGRSGPHGRAPCTICRKRSR